jgi:dienelactone hydrolase
MDWRIFCISLVVALACASATLGDTNPAGPEGLGQTPYAPPNGRGPIVILIPGSGGPSALRSYAADVAQLGYYAVLLGSATPYAYYPGLDKAGNSRLAIEQAQSSPNAIPGKAAVIGFSMGGGGALAHAASMPDLVSAVVAYYPKTCNVVDMRNFAAQFKVPILLLAGEKDTYNNCCLIESMRAMEAAAKEGGAPFELVVYPDAGHGFIMEIYKQAYRAEAAADAWQRTQKMLSQYHPLR